MAGTVSWETRRVESSLVDQFRWVPNLFRYMRIRAAYNAIPTDKNPYLKKGWRPNKIVVRVGKPFRFDKGTDATVAAERIRAEIAALLPPHMQPV